MARQIRNSRRGRRAGSRKGTRKGKKTYKKRRNSRRQIRGGGLTPGDEAEAKKKAQDELNKGAITGNPCSAEVAKEKGNYIGKTLQKQGEDYKTFPLYIYYKAVFKGQSQDIVKSLLRETVISICTEKTVRNRRLKKLLCATFHLEIQDSISETDINLLVDKFYDRIVQKGGIETDNDGKVVKFLIGDRRDDGFDGFDDKLESIFNNMTFDISQLKMLPQLTVINLNGRNVKGSIEHLKSLQNLTEIRLAGTQVSGDIQHLKSLLNLTYINLSNARDVTVSSEDLNTILHRPNLNKFVVDSTQVDISNISEEVKHKLSPMP